MNPVLAATDPLSPGETIVLVRFGGQEEQTRGTFARLKQTETQLRGALSESGFNAWIETPRMPEDVESVIVGNQAGIMPAGQYRVLDREVVAGSYWSTTRLQLVEMN